MPPTTNDAEAIYARATKAELDRDWDTAFSLYIKAAQGFLHLSRQPSLSAPSTSNRAGSSRTHSQIDPTIYRTKAGKALERAEKIKTINKNIAPVIVDALSKEEQFYVLQRGKVVNGRSFELWDSNALPLSSSVIYRDADGQPQLSADQVKFNPYWARPDEALSRQVENDDSALLPQDIIQHIVTDCSVCASLSVCLEHRRRFDTDLAASSLYPLQSRSGRYDVRLLFNGSWRRITIDDELPWGPDKQLMCMSARRGSVLWPSLLEKAYMKLMGGYDFPGSDSSTDLHAFTGWIPEHVEIKSSNFERERTWSRMLNGFTKGQCVVTLGTSQRSDIRWGDIRLMASHSYAVVDVSEVDDSEGGSERTLTVLDSWTETQHDSRTSLPEPRSLYMSWSDVCDVFDGVYLSWDPAVFTHMKEVHGLWKQGQTKSDDLVGQSANRCSRLTVQPSSEPCDDPQNMWLLLTRHVTDTNRSAEYIALTIEGVEDDDTTVRQVDISRISNKGNYSNSTHILVRSSIPASGGSVIVCASYDGQFTDVGFTLTAYTSGPSTWEEGARKAAFSGKVEGTLTNKTAGGNCTLPTFMVNPQYRLQVLPPTKGIGSKAGPTSKANMSFTLQGSRDVPLNLTVVWSQGERVFELEQKEIAASSGAYSYGLARTTKDLPMGDYTLIVSAFEPHHLGPFSLQLESSNRFEITAIPQEGAGMYSKTLRGSWDEGNAAGGPSFRKYLQNPSFNLEVSTNTQIKVRLQLVKPLADTPLNITMFPANAKGQHITTSGPYSETISGVATPQITVPKGEYVLIPSTYSPDIHTSFRVVVYSTSAVTVSIRS